MATILDRLFDMKDDGYADFQAKLTPTVPREKFIGVRVPKLRQFAKSIKGTPEADEFTMELPHQYYDENMLHSLLISQIKDLDTCLDAVERFLPFVDNWAVCDILSPKIFAKHPDDVLERIKVWISSDEIYTCRFGMEMLMSFYLDERFRPEYLEMPANVISEEYYVNMMIAWFFATALAKQWDSTIPYIESKRMGKWVHNKTIQKAIESYRITDEQKKYLRSLKV